MSAALEQQRILEDLASRDDEIRRLAVERLSALPARDAIPRLVERLGDGSWRVRKAAVERLVGCSEAEDVADALVEALADGENPGRRNSAVEALMACGGPVVPRLVEALSTDDIDVRKLLVDALAGIGDARATDAMIGTLSDPDPNVRAAAADALGVLGGEDAARALGERAVDGDEDQLVRFSALRALARLEWSLASTELAGVVDDPVLRPAVFSLLGCCEDDGAEAMLLKGLALSSRASREAAMEALMARLGRQAPAAVDGLARRIRETVSATDGLLPAAIDRLRDADLTTRLMLVQFLGLVGTPDCVVPILDSGRDEAMAEVAQATLEALGEVSEAALDRAWPQLDPELRRDACSLLARTGGSQAGARLVEALDDPDAELRAAAARALGARRFGDALPDLVRRLEHAALDEEPEAEDELAALLDALVDLAGPDAEAASGVEPALALLGPRFESSHEPVRRAATAVLARIARPQDAELVTAMLKDPSAEVRRLAVSGLTRLDEAVVVEPLRLALADESASVRVAAAGALGASSSDEVLDDLQRLLVDEDPRVRAAAVRGIGLYCSPAHGVCGDDRSRALDLLAAPLGEEGRGGAVAMAALEALEAIGGGDAARAARTALDNAEPEVVQAAVACIGRHGDTETLAELISMVQHPSWAVRGEAIETLAERRVAHALPAILRRLETEQDSFVRDVIVRALRRLEE